MDLRRPPPTPRPQGALLLQAEIARDQDKGRADAKRWVGVLLLLAVFALGAATPLSFDYLFQGQVPTANLRDDGGPLPFQLIQSTATTTLPLAGWNFGGTSHENAIAVSGGVGFQNSWVNQSSGANNAQYFMDSFGMIHVLGVIKSGSAIGTTAFTLPLYYRPGLTHWFAVMSNGTTGVLEITNTGAVIPFAGSTTSFSVEANFFP